MAVRHIVMWKLAGETREDRQAVAASIAVGLVGLLGQIPGLRDVVARPDTLFLDGNWDLVLVADFDDEEALAAYQTHPQHVAIATRIKRKATHRAAVDFEI